MMASSLVVEAAPSHCRPSMRSRRSDEDMVRSDQATSSSSAKSSESFSQITKDESKKPWPRILWSPFTTISVLEPVCCSLLLTVHYAAAVTPLAHSDLSRVSSVRTAAAKHSARTV